MMMAAAPLTSGSLGCRNFMHMILTAILFLSLPAECGGWVVPVPSRLTTMWRLMNSGPELLPLDRRNRHYDRLVKLRRWENSENGKRITTMATSFVEEDKEEEEAAYAASQGEIVSPFAKLGATDKLDDRDEDDEIFLPLTYENVEKVLDELRPYLIADGGNVSVTQIDGPVVHLELQGACGSCPSSAMTFKMGLERKLMEVIPEIQEVVQAVPDAPSLNIENIDLVLDSIRPFLKVAGSSIHIDRLEGVGGLQPQLVLNIEGKTSQLHSLRLEIMQRIRNKFMLNGLRIEFR